MVIKQIKDEAKTRLLKDTDEAFTEGAVYGINATVEEGLLLLQAKLGYEHPDFKDIKTILSRLKI